MVIDDERAVLNSLNRLLRFNNYDASYFVDSREALLELNQRQYDLIISDAKMPSLSAIEFLRIAKGIYPSIRNILISSFNDLDEVIEGFNEGVIHQYVPKPWDNDSLIRLINKQLELAGEASESEVTLKASTNNFIQKLERAGKPKGFDGFIGQNFKMKKQEILLRYAASSDESVVIQGAPGVGKSKAALAIHNQSSRRKHNFLSINCSHLP
jgi:DNA-binding NtrC family response regulator